MSAQTGRARKSQSPGADPSAPVIVKMGGGGDGVEYGKDTPVTSTPVTIDSKDMPFVELVPGQTWELSQSSSPGRIFGLAINDEKHPIEPSAELASVRIEFGGPELLLMESGAGSDIVMFIASVGVPINSTEEWTEATAPFPPITGVIFMVGTRVVVQKEFTEPAVTLTVDFQKTVQ